MASHVLRCLAACSQVERILLLSPDPPAWRDVGWRPDEGRGLNCELTAWRDRERSTDVLIIHADLPLLSTGDVDALVAAARPTGWAIAPDRHDRGTNALALAGGRTRDFAFGADSFARHCAHTPQAAVVRTLGLGLDVDTPEDLDAALVAGARVRMSADEGSAP